MALPPPEAGLTLDELERSRLAGEKYSLWTAEEIFGRNSSSLKAAELREKDPVRYRRLKREWAVTLGEIPGSLLIG